MAGGAIIRVAQPCGCVQEHFNGKARPKLCDCGHLFEKPEVVKARKKRAEQRAAASRARPTATRPRRRQSRQPERDWTDAQEKLEEEGCCRICKRTDVPLEKAHVLGREHDEPKVTASGRVLKVLYVKPERIFPACGPFPNGCHGDAEYRRINVLPFLTLDEQLQAVRDAGGIEAARIRLAPVENREEVERSAA